jgi:predicted house-cleaning noncanonical NTP pyrophosphatase (MazG superfamily)
MVRPPPNEEIAELLERVADLLEAQAADVHRVRAYRNAARTTRGEVRPLAAILEAEGEKGLVALPTIGRSIAASVREFVETGRLGMLDRLEGAVSPEDLFTTVPGIGEELARRIHGTLHVETLEELELAAHDGRLARVPGFGARRVRLVRDALASVLSRSARRRARRVAVQEAHRAATREPHEPSVEEILDVDAEYRRRAERGELRRIAPRRFNPRHEAWLPVLHTHRGDWSFTAMFSNTARAHQLGTTDDWVVLYYERDGEEAQCTVVTEGGGPLAGRRVVRGREGECARHYATP